MIEKSEQELKKPCISASQNLPELTFKAIFLGIILAMMMAGANAYLGLKLGSTVSACIPAAVISMAALRFFRESNVLENNIVQTTASAGEVVAAGVVFTLPALVIIGYWDHFSFGMTLCVVTIGGLLGVMLSVPLRRAFIVDGDLRFPEGVATAEVIQAGDQKPGETPPYLKELVWGGFCAAVLKFAQTGLQVMTENFHYWVVKGGTVFGFGGGFSAAVIGSGYIVGLHASVSLIAGGFIAWVVGVPVYGWVCGLPEAPSAYHAAMILWGTKIRFMGVGAMVVGGVWTLVLLIDPIRRGVFSSLEAFQRAGHAVQQSVLRTEKDIPFVYVLGGILLLTLPLLGLIFTILSDQNGYVPLFFQGGIVLALGLTLLLLAFLCSSISGYMAGILGSSQNPLSGVTMVAVLLISGMVLFCLDPYLNFISHPEEALKAAGAVILMGCVVACAAAVSGDNLQDLKSGQILGSTPWKQQVALMIGVVTGALTLAPITELLFQAYGMGDIMPRAGMDPSQVLSAPKAALMASLSQSVFSRSMDWTLFAIGGMIAVAAIFVDFLLKKRKSAWKLPVLGVAVGIYLPLEVTVPFFIGGLISFLADRSLRGKSDAFKEKAKNRGTLLSAGLIAGESLVGIILAVPFAAYQSTDVFKIPLPFAGFLTGIFGAIALVGLSFFLYRYGSRVCENKH